MDQRTHQHIIDIIGMIEREKCGWIRLQDESITGKAKV